MTKEKVQEMKEAVLTEKEQAMIEWLATTAYETIRDDFWEEAKEEYFSAYMSVITMLYQHEKTDAMFFICILLDQGGHEDFAQLITKVCNVEDGGVELFLNEFKDYLIYDMFYEEDEDDFDDDDFDDEPELYDVKFNPEIDEDPFAVISVAIDKEKCPQFDSKMKDVLQTLGISLPTFRKKEREEDE